MRSSMCWMPVLVLAGALLNAAAAGPGRVTDLDAHRGQRQYELSTEGGLHIRITFHRPDVFRIEAAPGGKYDDPKNDPKKAQIVVAPAGARPSVRVQESKERIEFATDALVLAVDRKDARFELRDAAGAPIWREIRPLQIESNATVQTLSTDTNEFFFGGGQQNGHFSHKGTKIAIRADGNWNEGGHPNPAPFYLSNRGYGVLRHTFATGEYDFTGETEIALRHDEARFDAYYFVGKSISRVVDLYTQFTGRPNFVTIWALELGEADAWMTRDKETKEPKKDEQGEFVEITPHVVSRLAEQYRKHDMPGGWILPNDGYGCGYVELERVVKELAALGFYTGLWTEKGLAKTKWEVGTAGTRAQKLDVAWTGPAYQFSLEANRQAWESLTSNSDTRGFVWTVQGWAGTHRYAICWTGDQYGSWDLIRYHIPTLIGSGLSGQAYATTDIDGIFGGSPETYTRDLQWKCFTPVLYAMSGWSHLKKSPWSYDEPYRSINRQYLKLKMRLTPYMYRYTREAWDTGAPIVRGLLWNFPEDRHTWTKATQHQYMLGDWFLVAPVYTSMKVNRGWRKEDIYLPAGRWVDYWDGRTIDGPATIDAYPITLEKLPLFVRGGAIIPMYPEMLYNSQKPKDPLTFDVYPAGDSQFELYEDDGVTRKYQQGEFTRQTIRCAAPPAGRAGDITVTVEGAYGYFSGMLLNRVYEFQIRTPVKPLAVTRDGQPVLELTEAGAYAGAVSAWHYDAADRRGIVHVRLPRQSVYRETVLRLDLDEAATIPPSPPYPVPELTPSLDKSEFVVTASSEQGGNGIRNAFDGTPDTMWHSRWGEKGDKYPYIVDIALGGLYPINGFGYLPRVIGTNGMLGDYELYVSRRTNDYGAPVVRGRFAKSKDYQTNAFPAVWGEYVRLRFLNTVHSNDYAAAAEFDLTQDLNAPPLPDEVAYLSDREPARVAGTYRKDRSAGGRGLVVNGQAYAKGLGVQASSELVYALDGTWDRLSGHVGVDSEVGSKGSVMFRVFADGTQVFESPRMSGDNVKQLMDVDIKGVRELRLLLDDQGDGSEDDHGDWIEARLIRKGSAPR